MLCERFVAAERGAETRLCVCSSLASEAEQHRVRYAEPDELSRDAAQPVHVTRPTERLSSAYAGLSLPSSARFNLFNVGDISTLFPREHGA